MGAQNFQQVQIQPTGSRHAEARAAGAPAKLGSIAPRIVAAQAEHADAVAALLRLQTGNMPLAAADAGLLAIVIFYWLFVVLAYAVDCWLTAPFIDEQITLYLSTLPHLAQVAFLWLSPAVFVALDITASLQRHHAIETGRGVTAWTTACVVLVLLAGLAVVSLQLTQENWDVAVAVKTAFLATFVMTVHAVLAFHQHAAEAIAYPLFAVERSSLNAKRNRSESDRTRLTQAFSNTYRLYLDDLRISEPGTSTIRRPELDVVTERVIAQIFGNSPVAGRMSGRTEDSSTSTQPDSSGAPTSSDPRQPSAPRADAAVAGGDQEGAVAENAYLRSVLDRQVRDADSEVTI